MHTIISHRLARWALLLGVEALTLVKFSQAGKLASTRVLEILSRNAGLSSQGIGVRRILLAFLFGAGVFGGRALYLRFSESADRPVPGGRLLAGVQLAAFLVF